MKDSSAVFINGSINGWECKYCKLYNDLLTPHCKSCYVYRPDWVTNQIVALKTIERGIFLQFEIGINMTEQEKLFQDFYNHEKLLVKDMDIHKLREHREELSKIAFEAKARLVAADDETRERTAKTKGKEWLTSVQGDQVSSDAINVIETRKKRMSKMDKLRADLQKIEGMTEETINEMIRGMEKKATESNLKTVTFKKTTEEIGVVQVEVKPKESNPFDPTALFGK